MQHSNKNLFELCLNGYISIKFLKGNAQFFQKMTFEPLMDFKQNHYGSWKILQKLLLLKVFYIKVIKTHNYLFRDSAF